MFRTATLALCSLALALCAAYTSASTTPSSDTFKGRLLLEREYLQRPECHDASHQPRD